jgi:HEAT repeat protein
MAANDDVTAKVDAVFSAVAGGDASGTGTLVALGDAAVPAVSGYLASTDENVRREAVALLSAIESEPAARALLPAMSDASADIREHAARAVLSEVIQSGPFDGLGPAVVKGLAAGEPAAATLLLGGFAADARRSLDGATGSTHLVKLADADLPVEARLAAQVALERLGDTPAGAALQEAIERGEVADLLFLLDVLPLLDDPSLIHALAARTLGDMRPAGGGVPAEVEPSRRVADRAVDALAARLRLKLSFAPDGIDRYSDADIAEVRQALNETIPN